MIHRWRRLMSHRHRIRSSTILNPRSLSPKTRRLKIRSPKIRNRRWRPNPTRDRRWCRRSSKNPGRPRHRRAAFAPPSEGRRVLGAKRPACRRVHRSVLRGSGRRKWSPRRPSLHPTWTIRRPGMERLRELSLRTTPRTTEHRVSDLHRRETRLGLIPGRPAVHFLGPEQPLELPWQTPRRRIGTSVPQLRNLSIPARLLPPPRESGTGRPVSVSPEGSAVKGIGRNCSRRPAIRPGPRTRRQGAVGSSSVYSGVSFEDIHQNTMSVRTFHHQNSTSRHVLHRDSRVRSLPGPPRPR